MRSEVTKNTGSLWQRARFTCEAPRVNGIILFMNTTAIVFVIVVVIGLSAFILFSNMGAKNPNPEAAILSTPTPNIVIPKATSPTPTFAIISANKATIKTVKGIIELDLYPQDAPKTVANFATLATNKYYDGLTFHRVEPGFVIQGGDPNGNGTGGTSIYGAKFEDELNPNTQSYKEGYVEGAVAMANSGQNTNGSQFFIMWSDHKDLPHNYTIFGKVTQGMDTVHKMVAGDKITSITVE